MRDFRELKVWEEGDQELSQGTQEIKRMLSTFITKLRGKHS